MADPAYMHAAALAAAAQNQSCQVEISSTFYSPNTLAYQNQPVHVESTAWGARTIWHRDTQRNDIQHNDTKHNDI